MTKKEAAIISAYTGIFIGSFHFLHKYIEEKLKRSIFVHELGNEKIADEIKSKSKKDFMNIEVI